MKILPKKFQKIFITGGAGFIGSHITDSLVKDNCEVTVFDNFTSGKKDFLSRSADLIKISTGDLLDPKQISAALSPKIDLVIHLAANPDISKGIEDPTLDFEQTILATFNLLMEMKAKGIKKLLYFSGSGVYGDQGEKYSKETHGPLLPVSMYGASKLSAESLISAFCHLFDMQVWIIRPANIIGGRATHGVIFDFIKKLKNNPTELTILGDGKQSKSYIYIDDVVSAISFILNKSNERINIFNIASNTFITVNEIAKQTTEALGLINVKIKHTGGQVGWPGDVARVRINSNKLRKLGWKEKCNSKEAVTQTIKDLLH